MQDLNNIQTHACAPSINSSDAVTVAMSGFAISFLGSLPLGTFNLLQVQLAASDGINVALWFSAGSLLPELIYVWISLAVQSLLLRKGAMSKALQWISVAILAALAIASIVASKDNASPLNALLRGGFSPFVFGFLLMAINPIPIAFWLGWNVVLVDRKILIPAPVNHALYITGIGLGTITADLLFILFGHFLFAWFPGLQNTFHLVIGGVYMAMALYLGWSNVRRR